MNKQQFLKEFREDIDASIKATCGKDYSINNNERWDWVINDEGLYNLARRNGVRV